MGSGASGLSEAQMGSMSKELKEKYEELKKAGTSDDDMQKILTDLYNQTLATKPAAEAPKKIGISAAAVNKKMASGSGKMNSGSTKSTKTTNSARSGNTRRRSFDVKKLPVTVSEPVLAVAEAVSASTTEEQPAEAKPETEMVDNWDSVTQQPFCKICQMGFKSAAFLERHVKYSDIHTRNVKAAEAKAASAGSEGAATTKSASAESKEFTLPISGFVGSTPSTKLNPRQVEGEHYKLVYSGSKFFWRTQETVDFDIYHHILPHTVEVISYDLVKGREMNRIYLNYTLMTDIINAGGIQWTDEDSQRSCITTFLLQRLQLKAMTKEGGGNSVAYVPLSGDSTALKLPVLEKPPLMLIPVPVVRRRRTNAEEIEATISSLASDREALIAATGMAEKVANLVYAGASAISAKKWWSDFNPVRKRWIWAIRKVIRQKLVKETKEILAARALAKEQSSKANSPKRKSISRVNSQSKEV